MAKIRKDNLDIDTTIVNIKMMLKGQRNMINICCTVAQCIEFVDYMNDNKAVAKCRHEREKFENKYYIFDDIKNKKNVMVSIPDVKYWEIPFFIDNGDEYDIKILTIN